MTDSRPIGIFDSGVGGLTVLNQLKKQLPNQEELRNPKKNQKTKKLKNLLLNQEELRSSKQNLQKP